MADAGKHSHFGKAGHLVAMAEFLLRGYNVAIPEVDVGDDIFVVDDRDGDLRRVQVKSASARARGALLEASFTMPWDQLKTGKKVDLYYMFMLHHSKRWDFLLIPRMNLLEMREAYIQAEARRTEKRRGRKPQAEPASNTVTLVIELDPAKPTAKAWAHDLEAYLNCWDEKQWPMITDGPGTTARAPARRPDRGS